MSQWSEEDFVPNAKFWKDWPLAFFLKNPLPPVPASWKYKPTTALFSGATGKYFHRLARYPSDKEDSFSFYRAVFGLAQSKRGFAPVPRSFVKKGMMKHAKQLSSPPTSEPDLEAARIFARAFFKGFRPPKIFSNLPSMEASMKASVEASIEKGGSRGFLRHLASEYFGTLTPDSDDFIRLLKPNATQLFEEGGLPPLSPDDWRVIASGYTPAKSRSYLSPSAQESIQELIRKDPSASLLPTARVAEILEPLKVRLVTAMDAVRTHVSRPLQRSLWKYVRSSPVFALIGEPISEALIYGLIDRHHKFGGGEDPFVSGDYSAATDGLDIRLSKVFLDVIMENLDPEDLPFKDFISSALLEQVLVYPSWTKIKPVVQKNGQLMGSILSFPILCIANLFAYIMSLPEPMKYLTSRSRMDKLPVLINGDDILFRSSDAHYEKWLVETRRVGFTQSIGKNFRHDRFFTVNSVPIEYRPPLTPFQFWKTWKWADIEESTIPWKVSEAPRISIRGFLNVGLLTGQAKLTGRDSLGALPLSGWHAGACLEALNPSQAHKWFLKYHRQQIKSQTRFGSHVLNIFAHPLLGGLGFSIPSGITPRYSPEQRVLAHSLFLSASYHYEGQESEFSLDTLVFLESDVSMPLSQLGRLNRRVSVALYPQGTPLPEGFEPFTDTSGVQPLAMVHSVPDTDSESTGLRARCRLPNRTLKTVFRRWNLYDLEPHPVDQMTLFPYIPVRIQKSTFIPGSGNPHNASTFVERPYASVYVQECPFQDISTPVPDSELVIPVSEPDDWESLDVTLVLPKTHSNPSPPITEILHAKRPHEGRKRKVLEKEIRATNQGFVYRRTAFEEKLFQ